jgi:hypothetical protein
MSDRSGAEMAFGAGDSNYPTGFSIAYHKLRRAASFGLDALLDVSLDAVGRLAEDVEIGPWSVPVRIIPFVEECIECFEHKRLFISSIELSLMLPPLAG